MYVPDVTVPDLKGLTLEQAELELRNKGLVLGQNPAFSFSDEVEVDKIIAQNYEPDTEVKTGRTVEVTVSKGMEILELPDVTTDNPDVENAIHAIRAAGFEGEISFNEMQHPTTPEGKVIGQNPAPKAQWPKNGKIKLFVSTGIELEIAVMPDVSGCLRRSQKYSESIQTECYRRRNGRIGSLSRGCGNHYRTGTR